MLLFLQYQDLQQLKEMGISDNILKNLTQVCVYWGTPTKDGRGGYTFDEPIEIDCRWKEHTMIREDDNGQEYVSKAVVYVENDVDKDGYLYLGDLEDLIDLEDSDSADSSGTVETLDPIEIDNAYIIKGFVKSKALKTVEYLRKAYL